MGGYFHHGSGGVGGRQTLKIAALGIGPGGKHLGAALAAKKNGSLVKNGQAGDLHRAGGAYKGVGGDAVEIPHVHGVEAPVKGDGLHVDVRIQQFGATRLHRHGPVQDLLAAPGGVDPQVLNTIFIGRYSGLKISNFGSRLRYFM